MQCGKLRPINGWGRLTSLGHPSKFHRVSLLASLLHRRRSTITEFCEVQNSLFVHVLRSPTLAALLHGTGAVGVSQTAAWYIQGMELQNFRSSSLSTVGASTYIPRAVVTLCNWPTFYTVFQKTATLFLVITWANEHRFSQFFHCEIPQEILYRPLIETSTSA